MHIAYVTGFASVCRYATLVDLIVIT